VQPGTDQVAVLQATPGDTLTLVASAHPVTAATGTVDAQGALLFRNVAPGDYVINSATQQSDRFTVADPTQLPPASFYANQPLLKAGGFGYITTRDGTTLSANVVLPGPADKGPYPTVVEYSGYAPSDPGAKDFASIYTTMGFAYVGVNMRGTGCSGGSYRFFEEAQNLDGYDMVEAVAAQPWVQDHQVGLVGISYPGISQLFVAATQPPSLAAITPLSVLDDSYRSTLYPGGILNTGFAVDWTKQRLADAKPYGEGWSKKQADSGDKVCADNQQLRLQNPDLLKEIRDNPFYSNPLGDSLAPATFVDRIKVPVFIAGAWQDEQTGGHFPVMLPKFTGSPHVFATLTNGLHTESLMPGVFQRYAEFLQLYVAKKVPTMTAVNVIVPILGKTITGVSSFPAYPDRFSGKSYDQALAAFEAEPEVRINFEEGAADGLAPGTPYPRFTADFTTWPVPGATATSLYLGAGGALGTTAPAAGAAPATAEYTADPTAVPATFYQGDGNGIWKADVTYDWKPIPDGKGVGFISAPLGSDTVVIGSGSVDLWIKAAKGGAPVDDTDLEATISEVRPDGSEVYVQSGWLRASQRALDASASTDLHPVQTHTEADAAPLPHDGFAPVRIELFPFAHPFRAGSRIRVTVHAPGNQRGVWAFETISAGETVTIDASADHPSRVVLPVVSGITVPAGAPACGSLRGEPCRTYSPSSTGG
jgi:predicted acyl esterase